MGAEGGDEEGEMLMKRAIIGIINGVDCQVKLDETKTIRALAKRVCTATNNTGRPFADWEVFTDAGVRLEKAAKISSLKDGQRVFFNLRVGIGGGR